MWFGKRMEVDTVACKALQVIYRWDHSLSAKPVESPEQDISFLTLKDRNGRRRSIEIHHRRRHLPVFEF